jgi:hypothetical protein
MHTVRVTRFRVKQDAAKHFEELAIAQAGRLYEHAPGLIAYSFLRRGPDSPRWSALLSRPLPGTADYVQIAVALDEAGEAQLSSGEATDWKQLSTGMLAVAPEVENIESPSWIAGVSRDHVWGPDSIFRATIYRMRVKPGEAALETAALRMMRSVVDREPDPPLYTITKRNPGGSPLLPAGLEGHAEYIRFHVYRTEGGLARHNQLDKEWWGAFYPQHLIAPLEGFQVSGADVLAGFSRAYVWGAADTYAAPE